MPHPRHEVVRARYGSRCGYCGVSEADAGGELTVDHFRPASAGGDDSDENLVYACFRCNNYKGDFLPTAGDLANGHRLLHPLRDDVSVHVRLDEQSGLLQSLTETGRFHLFLLRLNRPQLIERRRTLRLRERLEEAHQLLQRDNEELRRRIAVLEAYLQEIIRLQGEKAD